MTVLDAKALASLLAPKRHIVDIKDSDNLQHALHLMNKYELKALPVKNDQGKYYRTLSIAELLFFVLQVVNMQETDEEEVLRPKFNPRTFLVRGALASPVKDALAIFPDPFIDRDDIFLTLTIEKEKIQLDFLVEKLFQGVKRVIIQIGGVQKLFTQTDICRHLINLSMAHPRSVLAALMKTSLGRLREVARESESLRDTFLPKKYPILAVPSEAPLLEAIELLVNSPVDAVPVTDFQDAEWTELAPPSTTFSLSDARRMTPQELENIAPDATVKSFLMAKQENAPRKPLMCKEHENLGEVVLRMLTENVHRTWFCGASGVVEGVLSFTDVLRMVLDQLKNEADWTSLSETGVAA